MSAIRGIALAVAAAVIVSPSAVLAEDLPDHFLGSWELSAWYVDAVHYWSNVAPDRRQQLEVSQGQFVFSGPAIAGSLVAETHVLFHESTWLVWLHPDHWDDPTGPFGTQADPVELSFMDASVDFDGVILCPNPPCMAARPTQAVDPRTAYYTRLADPTGAPTRSWSSIKARF